ncbi:MAG: molybdopterin cofactor-binding domain-containing protein [Burkholderiales bacterium]
MHPKHLAVLEAAAARAGWGKPAAPGVFRGLAQHMGFGSYTAAVAEVSVSKEGALKIHRIDAATDSGHAVNPQQIAAQVEGSFAYGLSACLYGECTVKDGRIEQENFNTYEVMRLADMPKVETIVMPSGGFWGGVGEPTISAEWRSARRRRTPVAVGLGRACVARAAGAARSGPAARCRPRARPASLPAVRP